jgi:hypothetical protein
MTLFDGNKRRAKGKQQSAVRTVKRYPGIGGQSTTSTDIIVIIGAGWRAAIPVRQVDSPPVRPQQQVSILNIFRPIALDMYTTTTTNYTESTITQKMDEPFLLTL